MFEVEGVVAGRYKRGSKKGVDIIFQAYACLKHWHIYNVAELKCLQNFKRKSQ